MRGSGWRDGAALRWAMLWVLLAPVVTPHSVGASVPGRDTTFLSVTAGLAVEAHADHLASPFRQTGTLGALGVSYRTGGLRIEAGTAKGRTNSILEGSGQGLEDLWTSGFDVGWVHGVAAHGGTRIGLGGSLSALAFVRRHHYGQALPSEYFVDFMVPLSVVAEVDHGLGDATRLRNHLAVGLLAELFRSPFSGTKGFPPGSLATPGELRLIRNKVTLIHTVSRRVRLSLTHSVTFYDTQRGRRARLVHQELRGGFSLVWGGGSP